MKLSNDCRFWLIPIAWGRMGIGGGLSLGGIGGGVPGSGSSGFGSLGLGGGIL